MDFAKLINAFPGAISQGAIWGIMAIGVYITYRILDVADLTVDGTMVNPWIAVMIAFVAGLAAGLVTGILHTGMGIPAILSGILTQLALYSINLRIMDGKANTAVNVNKFPVIVTSRNVRDISLSNPFVLLVIITCISSLEQNTEAA